MYHLYPISRPSYAGISQPRCISCGGSRRAESTVVAIIKIDAPIDLCCVLPVCRLSRVSEMVMTVSGVDPRGTRRLG